MNIAAIWLLTLMVVSAVRGIYFQVPQPMEENNNRIVNRRIDDINNQQQQNSLSFNFPKGDNVGQMMPGNRMGTMNDLGSEPPKFATL